MGYDSVFMYIDSSLAMYHQKTPKKLGPQVPLFRQPMWDVFCQRRLTREC